MTRPQHRTVTKSDEYFRQSALYYRDVCVPAVDNKQADIIFKALNGELDLDDYTYVTNPLGSTNKKFSQFPSRMRNFDILSPVYMLLMGEKRRRGLRYTVVARNSNIESQRAQLEADMTDKMLIQQLIAETVTFKKAQGEQIDVAQTEQITVEKIQKESQSLQDSVAIMGQNALDYIRDYTELDRKFVECWSYWICLGRTFSFREPWKDEVHHEPISPKELKYLAGSQIRFIEDAEAVVRRVIMPFTEVCDKFDEVEGFDKVRKALASRMNMGVTEGFRSAGYTGNGMSEIDPGKMAFGHMWSNLFGKGQTHSDTDGVAVEHVVWTSEIKVGKLKGINIYGEPYEEEVDHDFQAREGEEIEWGWCKIKAHSYVIDDKYTIGGELLPHTLSEIDKPFSCKNPYNGRVFNLRHTNPVGIMQKGLAFQAKVNIIHYYIEKTMAKNMDKIVILPLGLIAEDRGHTMESTMYYSQSHGFLFVDETKKNFQAAMNGVKVLDADLSAHIDKLWQYLTLVKQEWKELVGVTPAREGQMANSNDGKALMENSVFRSSVMTEEWFAEFEEFEQRDLQYLMEISKYAFHKGKKAMFVNTDKSHILLDVDPELFCYSDYLTRVANSGKDLEDLERAKAQAQALAQNMGGKYTPLLKVIRSNNISLLISEMEKVETEFDAQQQAQAQQQQQVAAAIQDSKERVANMDRDWKYYNTDTMAAVASEGNNIKLQTADSGIEDNSGDDLGELLQNNLEREKMNRELSLKERQLEADKQKAAREDETKRYVADKQYSIAKVNKN